MAKSTDQKIIRVGNITFEHVKTRLLQPVMIFRNKKKNLFFRIGPKALVEQELQLHRNLLASGFPVPAIKSEGMRGNKFYYIETSLGDTHIGDLFIDNCQTKKYVTDNNFNDLMDISTRVAQAQLNKLENIIDNESLYLGLHIDQILIELPRLSKLVLQGFEKFKKNTSGLPRVITHGDFNPYNIFKTGIIDFGSMHQAPAGYDLVTNIYHTYNFPKTGDCELLRTYTYSKKQIGRYFNKIDKVYRQRGLPPASNFKNDFIFARSIWSTAQNHQYPKLQKWRYKRFKKILTEYLKDKSLVNFVVNYPD